MAAPKAAVFTIKATSSKPRLTCMIPTTDAYDIFQLLGEAAGDVQFSDFLYIHPETKRSVKVLSTDRDSIEDFVSAMRTKLLAKLKSEQAARLLALEQRRAAGGLEQAEKDEMRSICCVEQDLILSSHQESFRSATPGEASSSDAAANPIKSITLRFPAEKDSTGNVIEVPVPFSAVSPPALPTQTQPPPLPLARYHRCAAGAP
jgi:hypothetical protein